jgi:hypothetical protein
MNSREPDPAETEVRYGPVELVTIGFSGEHPPTEVVDAILRLAAQDTITILDLLVLRKADDGSFESFELENLSDDPDIASVELEIAGLTGDEDLALLAQELAPRSSAIVAAIELTWARQLVAAIEGAGAAVISDERIPAWAVNEAVAAERATH